MPFLPWRIGVWGSYMGDDDEGRRDGEMERWREREMKRERN